MMALRVVSGCLYLLDKAVIGSDEVGRPRVTLVLLVLLRHSCRFLWSHVSDGWSGEVA